MFFVVLEAPCAEPSLEGEEPAPLFATLAQTSPAHSTHALEERRATAPNVDGTVPLREVRQLAQEIGLVEVCYSEVDGAVPFRTAELDPDPDPEP